MGNQETEFRTHILNEIRRLATETGKAPGIATFKRATGISEHEWSGKLWARWADALAEAGYVANELQKRFNTDFVLEKVIEVCRHYGKIPTHPELLLYKNNDASRPTIKTINRHFGNRAGLIAALAKLTAADESYADIKAMLPAEMSATAQKALIINKTAEGFVYLIKSGDHYKIGQTENIERRFKEIGISLPDKATIIHTIRTDDPPGIEAYWHNRFKEKRANGEWFKLSSTDISAFRKRKFQ
jgi:hypothetical protein